MPAPHPIEGIWQMIRGEFRGESVPEFVAERTTIEFAAGIYTVRFADEITDQGAYELGRHHPTQTLNLQRKHEANAAQTISCTIQLMKDRLRLSCRSDATHDGTTGDYVAYYRRSGADPA